MKKLLFLFLLLPFFGYTQTLNVSLVADAAPIVITMTGSFAPFTVVFGNNSASQSVALSSRGLTNPVTIPCPAGFQSSPDNSTWGTSTLSYSPSAGIITGNFWLRIPSTTAVGSNSGNAVATSSPASPVNIPWTYTVSPVPSLVISPTSRTVSGVNGTAGTFVTDTATFIGLGSSVAVTTTSPLEVSVDSGVSYGTSKTMANSPTVMRVRTAASASVGTGTDTVFLNATGVSVVKLPVAYTVTSSSSSADTFRFGMSLTSQTQPAGFVNLFGDPSTGVRTATNGAGNVTISSVSTANWGPVAGGSANDGDGVTGSTVAGFPDNLLLRQYFTYSDGSNTADSSHQTLANPNFVLTGLNPAATYHLEMTANIDAGRFALTCTNKFRAKGILTTATIGTDPNGGLQTINFLGNTSRKLVISSITPDASGKISIYIFTETGQELGVMGALQGWKN